MKIIEKEELATLVPHRGKMFIIDRITDWDADSWKITSETTITKDFMFYDESVKGVPNYAIFEIVAQTAAALTGIFAKNNNLSPGMGMILSVSNLNIDIDYVKEGQKITVRTFRESDVGNVYSFFAQVFIDGAPCGDGKLTVMEAGTQGM